MDDSNVSGENRNASKVTFSSCISQSSESKYSDEEDKMEITCDVCEKKFSGIESLTQHEKSLPHKKALKKKKIQERLKIRESVMSDSDDDDLMSHVLKPIKVCKPCNKEFFSPESYIQHLASKDHKRKMSEGKVLEKVIEGGKVNKESLQKMLKKPVDQENSDSDGPLAIPESVFQCEECDKVFSGLSPYTQHMTSKSHEKKMKQLKMLKGVVGSQSVQHAEADSNIEVEDGVLVCRMCSMSFSGPESAMAHLAGRQHKKKFELKEFFEDRLTEKQKQRLKINDASEQPLKQKDVEENNGKEIPDGPSAESDEKNSMDRESDVKTVSLPQTAGSESNNSSDNDSASDTSAKYKKYKNLIDAAKADGLALNQNLD